MGAADGDGAAAGASEAARGVGRDEEEAGLVGGRGEGSGGGVGGGGVHGGGVVRKHGGNAFYWKWVVGGGGEGVSFLWRLRTDRVGNWKLS